VEIGIKREKQNSMTAITLNIKRGGSIVLRKDEPQAGGGQH